MVAQVGIGHWGGVGDTPNTSRVLFESLARGWHGQVKGLTPHVPCWDLELEPGCSTRGESVVFICTLVGKREREGRDNQSALKHSGSGLDQALDEALDEGRETSGT